MNINHFFSPECLPWCQYISTQTIFKFLLETTTRCPSSVDSARTSELTTYPKPHHYSKRNNTSNHREFYDFSCANFRSGGRCDFGSLWRRNRRHCYQKRNSNARIIETSTPGLSSFQGNALGKVSRGPRTSQHGICDYPTTRGLSALLCDIDDSCSCKVQPPTKIGLTGSIDKLGSYRRQIPSPWFRGAANNRPVDKGNVEGRGCSGMSPWISQPVFYYQLWCKLRTPHAMHYQRDRHHMGFQKRGVVYDLHEACHTKFNQQHHFDFTKRLSWQLPDTRENHRWVRNARALIVGC